MDREDQFLIEEYKSAVKLTYHIDELRNKLTTFFLTIAGFGGAGLSILFKGEAKEVIFINVMATFLLMIGIIGLLFVIILAKLRKVQLEHFRILDNIRKHFFNNNYSYWNTIQLSSKTIPSPNRHSGTYVWLLVLIMVGSFGIALSIYLFCNNGNYKYRLLATVASFCAFFLIQDWIYFKMASPPNEQIYSDDNLP